MAARRPGMVQHWKHGWIPISPEAKAYVAGTGPKPQALDVRGYDELSPSLQGKINDKLEALTGIPEPELARRVQQNLVDLYQKADKSQADWYYAQEADIARRAAMIADEYPGSRITPERLTGMIAVTSAHKRWQENVDFAENIARKLAADEPFQVTPEMIANYNAWAAKRHTGLARPHPELKPGTYRPSELPADFAASKTPDMPKALNTDYVVRATQIARGTPLDEAIGGPKQRSFTNNLTDPADKRYVTVDTWQYVASMGDIPLRRTVKGREYNYTLDQWASRDLSVTDGRADAYGYDHSLDRYDDDNIQATIKGADQFTPQLFFQSGPASVKDNYKGQNGTYPWFVKQTQLAAEQAGVSPLAMQAVTWYAIGGGA